MKTFLLLPVILEAARIGSPVSRAIRSKSVYLQAMTEVFHPATSDVKRSHMIIFRDCYAKCICKAIPPQIAVSQGEVALILRPNKKPNSRSIADLVSESEGKDFFEFLRMVEREVEDHQIYIFTGEVQDKISQSYAMFEKSLCTVVSSVIITLILYLIFGH